MKTDALIFIDGEVYDRKSYDKGREDERNRLLAKIRVGLGKVKTMEYSTEDGYVVINYYNSKDVLALLARLSEEAGKC